LDLSERRAATVAKYLIDNNPKVTVNSISGIGAVDATTGRVVVLTLK
jgi:outer membrane protein OmpA-like peptidoglycan-associated protein